LWLLISHVRGTQLVVITNLVFDFSRILGRDLGISPKSS
jgi:hypothetical protein